MAHEPLWLGNGVQTNPVARITLRGVLTFGSLAHHLKSFNELSFIF